MRAVNSIDRHRNTPFHQSAFCWNEVIHNA
jgi:hypothetical protein